MKKIFLLTLLSVFFLSAFSQTSTNGTEILTKIQISQFIDDDEIGDPLLGPGWWWKPFYKIVQKIPRPGGGVTVICEGRGWKLCWARRGVTNDMPVVRGLSSEVIEDTHEKLITEYEERFANKEHSGSITKKIAFSDPLTNGRTSYLILQIKWDNDPKKPCNGKAEITISKTNDLGISTGRE